MKKFILLLFIINYHFLNAQFYIDTLLRNEAFVKKHNIKSVMLTMHLSKEKFKFNFNKEGKLESMFDCMLDTFEHCRDTFESNKYNEKGLIIEKKEIDIVENEKYRTVYKYNNDDIFSMKYNARGDVMSIDSIFNKSNRLNRIQYLRLDNVVNLYLISSTQKILDKSQRIIKQIEIQIKPNPDTVITNYFYNNQNESCEMIRSHSQTYGSDTLKEKYVYEKNGDLLLKTTYRTSTDSRPREIVETYDKTGLISKTTKEQSGDEHDYYTLTFNPPSVLTEYKREGRDGGVDFLYLAKIENDKNNLPVKIEMFKNNEEEDMYFISYTFF